MENMLNRKLTLDGSSLTIADLVRVSRDPRMQVTCDALALQKVERSSGLIKDIVSDYGKMLEAGKTPVLDYGITTGYGEFKSIAIDPADLELLSERILLSHATGIGDDSDPDNLANYFPAEIVRAVLVIRLNAFLKGHSGVRTVLVGLLERMINRGIVPLVPLHGSVGSSGDLCPLSHLFVVALGEGRFYVVRKPDDMTPSAKRTLEPAGNLQRILSEDDPTYKLPDPRFASKEGLALTNGATFSAAMLALATHDAEILANTADIAVAMSLEAVCGCARAFDKKIHKARNLRGQIESATNIRRLLRCSKFIERRDSVQDAYSMRCAPAVHGSTRDTIAYAQMIVQHEINAATDNPLFFPASREEKHQGEPWDATFHENWKAREVSNYRGQDRASYSAGNFHGQPIGQSADFLAIAIAELANISERRTQTLLDANHSQGLPPNLIPRRGVNSGFMIAQYAAASLVSENKILAHPASVDSIPTSANTEDHVAMATAAGRKLVKVLRNSQAAVAIELLVAAQAVEWRATLVENPADPWTSPATESEAKQRARSRNNKLDDLFKEFVSPTNRGKVNDWLGTGTGAAYATIRGAGIQSMLTDQTLDEPIRRTRRLVENGVLVKEVDLALAAKSRPEGKKAKALRSIRPLQRGR